MQNLPVFLLQLVYTVYTMPSMSFKHSNGRIQHRATGGTFRQSTLSDVGLGCCDKCGGIFTPDLSDLGDAGLIDPREFRRRQQTCGKCLGLPGAEEPAMRVQG